MPVFVVFLVRIFPHLNWKPSVCYDTCLCYWKIFLEHFYWEISSHVTCTILKIFLVYIQSIFWLVKAASRDLFFRFFAFYCKVFNQLKNMPFIVRFSVSCKISIVTLILKVIFLSCSCENFHRDLQSKSPYSFQIRENKDQKNAEWALQASVSIHKENRRKSDVFRGYTEAATRCVLWKKLLWKSTKNLQEIFCLRERCYISESLF